MRVINIGGLAIISFVVSYILLSTYIIHTCMQYLRKHVGRVLQAPLAKQETVADPDSLNWAK